MIVGFYSWHHSSWCIFFGWMLPNSVFWYETTKAWLKQLHAIVFEFNSILKHLEQTTRILCANIHVDLKKIGKEVIINIYEEYQFVGMVCICWITFNSELAKFQHRKVINEKQRWIWFSQLNELQKHVESYAHVFWNVLKENVVHIISHEPKNNSSEYLHR